MRIIHFVMNRWQKGCLGLVVVGVALMASPFFLRSVVKAYYDGRSYEVVDTPARPVAIVFGAAVYGDRLSSVLRDRVDTAITLYQSGVVDRIIVSGGTDDAFYNEPNAMRAYAVERGVPASAIIPDYEGNRTYDTCFRARHTLDVESAILVTQAFHLPRSLLTCRWLGIDAVGAVADQRPYRGARWYEVRETAATVVALWDVLRREPPPAWESAIAPN